MSDFGSVGAIASSVSDMAQSAQEMAGTTGGQQGAGAQLPQTGLQQQLNSLNSLYDQVQGIQQIGFDPRQQQFQAAQAAGGGELSGDYAAASGSLDQMARDLAQRYGLPIGRGRLVDEAGNFLMTPDQVAAASGGALTQGEAAAQMNYIAQAISKQQTEQANQQSIAALETGLGQVQSRGRGSLASMQSGFYQDLANVYQRAADRGDYESADFSYYIQQEQLQIQQELMRRAEDLQKKQSRMGTIVGAGMLIGGIFSGNLGLIGGGASMFAGSAGGTGWF